MTHPDVDLFHDQLLDEGARAAFLARVADDAVLKRDLAFRSELDGRLRRVFGAPPDFAKMIDTPPRSPFGHGAWFAVAAMLLIGLVLAFSLWDSRAVDSEVLWKELTPVLDCRAPIINSDQLARHCASAHGAEVQIQVTGDVYVHGPTKSVTFPEASVLTVVLPSAFPDRGTDIRVVLIGEDLPIRETGGVRVFRREVRGVQLVEMTTASESRALVLFR